MMYFLPLFYIYTVDEWGGGGPAAEPGGVVSSGWRGCEFAVEDALRLRKASAAAEGRSGHLRSNEAGGELP
jgi:hypothetical protein